MKIWKSIGLVAVAVAGLGWGTLEGLYAAFGRPSPTWAGVAGWRPDRGAEVEPIEVEPAAVEWGEVPVEDEATRVAEELIDRIADIVRKTDPGKDGISGMEVFREYVDDFDRFGRNMRFDMLYVQAKEKVEELAGQARAAADRGDHGSTVMLAFGAIHAADMMSLTVLAPDEARTLSCRLYAAVTSLEMIDLTIESFGPGVAEDLRKALQELRDACIVEAAMTKIELQAIRDADDAD